MANTYTQMYVHVVFAVWGRANVIKDVNRVEVEKHVSGIVSNKRCKLLAIYINPDHTHLLFGLHPAISVSDLTRDVKANSSKFINEQGMVAGIFRWQDGFASFTYSKSQLDKVVKYILNQPEHHKKETFKHEFLKLLKRNEIDFDDRYLFEWYE